MRARARHITRLNYIDPLLGDTSLMSQVVLLQTAHSWANARVLVGARMHRERGRGLAFEQLNYPDEVSERKVKVSQLVNHVQYDVVVT